MGFSRLKRTVYTKLPASAEVKAAPPLRVCVLEGLLTNESGSALTEADVEDLFAPLSE